MRAMILCNLDEMNSKLRYIKCCFTSWGTSDLLAPGKNLGNHYKTFRIKLVK